MKASLSRTNEASLSADFCRRDKKTDEERRLRDTWRKIQREDDWAGLTDPMDPVLRSELIRNGEMAQACYDAFDFDPSSRYCGNPCRVLASKCITSPFRSDVGCWFDEALRTQAVLLEAGFLNIFGIANSRAVSVWTGLDNALRSRSGKTEQRHRVHFTFKRSHWSMHSTWKLWAQGKEMFSTSCPIWSSSKQIKHSPQSSGTAFNLNFGSSQQNDKTCLSRSQVKSRMDEPIDKSKHWGDLEEEEQEEEMDEEELEDDMESVDTLSSRERNPIGLYIKYLKNCSWNSVVNHTHIHRVDISLQPEELEAMYEEVREEERNYAIGQRTSVTWSPRCKKYIRYESCKHDKSQGKKPHWFSVSHGSHYTLHLKRNKTNSRNKEEEQKLCHAVLAANHFMCMGANKELKKTKIFYNFNW
ncbi:hypothetical protein Bca4012_072126 [Brassica carinata]